MKSYSRSQFTDDGLLATSDTRLCLDLDNTADLLADLAEVEPRKLCVPAGDDSMCPCSVHERHMSEGVGLKRIRVARVARLSPAVFPMLADGRPSSSAVVLLAPRLTSATPATADRLLSAAARKTNAQIEPLLGERFPKPDMETSVREIAPAVGSAEVAAGPDVHTLQLTVRPVVPSDGLNTAVRTEPLPAPTSPVPLSSGKYAVQFTMDEDMHEDLLAVQALRSVTCCPRETSRRCSGARCACCGSSSRSGSSRSAIGRGNGRAARRRAGTSLRRSRVPYTSATVTSARS